MTFVDPFSTATPEVQRQGSHRAPTVDQGDGALNDLLQDDEETRALTAFRARTQKEAPKVLGDMDPIEAALERSFKGLQRKYTSGAAVYRFITADILLEAPAGWFERFDQVVKAGVGAAQNQIASSNRSAAIAEAQANPTDDSYQDAAFSVVYSAAADFMDKQHYKGIQRQIIIALIANEIIGFSKIDPLWRDRKIDEILINGPKDIQVEVAGQLIRVESCTFRDEDQLMGLIERIYGAINKTVSKMTPLVKGRLHDQSRIFAVHSSVAPEGPNLAIRRHPERFWTPQDLVERGSLSKEVATFLGNLIYKGCSFVVLGGTSTGKTSFLNAMTGFYRDDVRLLTLEDNLEMKPNPKKMLAAAMECKPPVIDMKGYNGVSMRDLVKGALQMRPDGIIIGEVTDGAAYDLAQALNTGHFGASTIHANSEYDGIYRIASLISQGELVSAEKALPLIAAAFDFVILLEHFPVDGSRRLVSISEIDPYVQSDGVGGSKLGVKQLWRFESTGLVDEKVTGHWVQTGDISEIRAHRRHLNLEADLTWEQLQELSSIPEVALKPQDD